MSEFDNQLMLGQQSDRFNHASPYFTETEKNEITNPDIRFYLCLNRYYRVNLSKKTCLEIDNNEYKSIENLRFASFEAIKEEYLMDFQAVSASKFWEIYDSVEEFLRNEL